jgi:hypothetical protein
MTDANPYDPPASAEDLSPPQFRILCVTMFWLSAVFGAFAFVSAILIGVQNYLAMGATGGSLPTYIPLLVLLTICCSFGFAWSARKWRSRLIRAALISFILSLVALVIGPYVLLTILYGPPTSLN